MTASASGVALGHPARAIVSRALGDVELDGAETGVPFPLATAVAVGQPCLGALMQPGTDQLRHLRLHQLLGEQLETSRRNSGSAPCSDLFSRSSSVILGLAIVVVLLVVG